MSQPFENRGDWESPQFGIPAGNPYSATPNVFSDEAQAKGGLPYQAPVRRRPGGVTAICILAIILGCLGALPAFSNIFNALSGGKMQQMFTPTQPGMTKEMEQAQADMQAALVDLTRRYSIVNGVIGVLHLALIVALVWSSIRTLGMSDKGRRFLQITMFLAIVFEIGRAIPATALQLEMAPIMQQHSERMMESAVPPGKKLGPSEEATLKMMPKIMMVAMWFGVAVALVWVLLKIIFYGISARVLGGPKVKAVYDAPPNAPPGAMMPGQFPGAPA